MTRRETPAVWLELMESKRLHSIRDLGAALSVSPQTASRLVHGDASSRQTIEAAAELLGVTPERIRQMRHETPLSPFRLPPEADQLGPRQRAAIVAVVRAMLEPTDASSMSSNDDLITEEAVALQQIERARERERNHRRR